MSTGAQTFEFQAEARQVLDLMIHSVYSNRDIFLRELISNSSDALDRLRFEAISNPELLPSDTELHIRISVDRDARTVTVSDNGIGMTREEVIELIGSIAKSGTKAFVARLKELKGDTPPPELIGQFGVGFYSSFLVADRVTLVTRRAGTASAVRWESDGKGYYSIDEGERSEQGTTVTLHLAEGDPEDDLDAYLDEWKIREIVRKYSDFVAYPIRMEVERREVERDAEGKPVEGAEEKLVKRDETLNSMKAIWLRPPSEVTDAEYNEFYKHIAHDWTEPLARIRAEFEGTLMYRILLYIPAHAPMDLYRIDGRHGVQLYVKRVFIMEDCDALIPDYLRFIRGVVDSEDLSLNISRELLQQNRQIQQMQRGIVGKVLDTIRQMESSEPERFEQFWREFGRVLKEGIHLDASRRDDLLGLARFSSTRSDSELTTLRAYVERMPASQQAIYYITGKTRGAVEASPHLEAFRERGYEVLLLTDPIDELWTQVVSEYEGKPLQSVAQGAVDLSDDTEKERSEDEREEEAAAHASLLERLQQALDAHVKEVRLSSRLTTSPACLVGDTGDLPPQLEQLLRATNQDVPVIKRILEINPKHPILDKLQGIYDADPEDARLADYAKLIYGQAVLAENGQPPDPAEFSRLVAELMTRAI